MPGMGSFIRQGVLMIKPPKILLASAVMVFAQFAHAQASTDLSTSSGAAALGTTAPSTTGAAGTSSSTMAPAATGTSSGASTSTYPSSSATSGSSAAAPATGVTSGSATSSTPSATGSAATSNDPYIQRREAKRQ